MRVVFLFFLLVNAAYFYTQSDFFKEEKAPAILKKQTLPKGVDQLTLLRERGLGVTASETTANESTSETSPNAEKPGESDDQNVESQPEVEGEKTIPDVSEPSEMACFTLGPFTQASTAGRTAEAISALGVTVNRRQTTERRPRGYWVYLPAFKTYSAARKRVEELQKKGLKDMFIMGKGEHKNAVSLGLFKRKSAADERYEQVKKMGLSVEIETQYRVTKLAWLDMEVPGDQASTIAAINEMVEQMPKTSIAKRQCK